MEKGADNSSGLSLTDKKTSSKNDAVCLVKMHSTVPEPFPFKICSVEDAHHQKNHLGRPFGGGDDGGGGVGGVCPSGGADEVMSNIYRDHISFAGDHSTNLQQPFENFPYAYAYNKNPALGEMDTRSVSVGFPFTCAQWKELERQAMIYKYMISSVPVPHDLLFPLSTDFRTSSMASSASPFYSVRYLKNGDPEPGRCKRTDGKKWRCSRDVAPQQKYCERHLHRGRPRSRKPVEVKNNGENRKRSRLEQNPLPKSSSQSLLKANEPVSLFNNRDDLSISTAPSYKNDRDVGLVMDGEMVGIDHQWQQLMESHMGLSNEGFSIYGSNESIFNHDYVEHEQPFDLFSYSDYQVNSVIEEPVGFIDAWSFDNLNNHSNDGNPKSSVSTPNHGNLSPSLCLSIAMAAGDVLDEEMSRIQFETDVKDCDDDGYQKAKEIGRLNPVSWEPFSHGGPLAEALQPGSCLIGNSNPVSPYDSIGSMPVTTVSSQSGVLHRKSFSQSDSSDCNSPTFGAQVSNIRSCIPVSHLD